MTHYQDIWDTAAVLKETSWWFLTGMKEKSLFGLLGIQLVNPALSTIDMLALVIFANYTNPVVLSIEPLYTLTITYKANWEF